MTAPAVKSVSRSSSPAPLGLDVNRARRGRFLAKHNARVIEQDNLVIVEFVDQAPWYTQVIQESTDNSRTVRTFSVSLLCFSVGSFSLGLAHLFNWI